MACQFRMVIYFFRSIYKISNLRKTKLGQVAKVRAHYPSYFPVIQGGGDESYAAVRGDEAESPEEGKTYKKKSLKLSASTSWDRGGGYTH